MKQKIILLIAILIGALAFWMTNYHLRIERAKLYAGAEKVTVLVASKNLPAGTILTRKDLGVKDAFKSSVGSNVAQRSDYETVLGRKITLSLERGENLWWTHIEVSQTGRNGFAGSVKSGLRAVSIGVSGTSAVAGLVAPNDRVDILGTFEFPSRKFEGEMETVTLTVLQDVTVLATGQTTARVANRYSANTARRSGGYNSVTLEVTPREAELLVFAEGLNGNLTLTLRNPDDVSFEEDLPEINFEHIEEKLPELNEFRQKNIRGKGRF